MRGVLLFAALLAWCATMAQHSSPDSLFALRIHEPITLDGTLDEPCWSRAIHIRNFTQRDPNEGAPGTDLTDVAIVYDSLALYVGATLPVMDPEHMMAKYMERDFAWYADDNFQFVISTFNDHRNGYLFVTNPNGARGDMQVSPTALNVDWNGVWDVVTSCTDIGWTAEFRIPFNTLQFPKDSVQHWGINFERNVRSKNEQTNWQGWGRNGGGGTPWSIDMVVTAERGDRCGTIEYPSLRCGGYLTHCRRQGDVVTWTEVYTHNPGTCAPAGVVDGRCDGATMAWTWTGWERVRTTLTRAP